MRERPILFSETMVKALLAGRKSQTRRIVKSPAKNMQAAGMTVIKSRPPGDRWYKDCVWSMRNNRGVWGDYTHDEFLALCPYGKPGDRLWVREAWAPVDHMDFGSCDREDPVWVGYRADHSAIAWETGNVHGLDTTGWGWDSVKWKSPLFMPRWASRITLEITEVRVQRVQAIGDFDADQEGVKGWVHDPRCETARDGFRVLWEDINGAGSWAANPWVWAISFRRVTP